MRIAVLGTGSVGRTLAGRLADEGHDVVVATRSPEETAARAEWQGSALALVPFEEAAEGVDLVVNATNGAASVEAVSSVGPTLDGVVVLDAANPLDFSAGFPPTLLVKDDDSLAEQIQRAVPSAKVVKALNMMTASVMLDPMPGSSVLVAGDDPDARRVVTDLLTSYGWDDIVELPALEAARGMEMWLPLWLRLMGALGTPEFNLKIVR